MRPAGLTAPESFSISVVKASWSDKTRVVLLTGPDLRGTIYAIYQFSQQYLGIDPMYYWTDYQPARRTSIEIPASLSHAFPAPLFKYRGFFINDEDLLTGWAPGEAKDKSGISLAVMEIYETILRLKGNMVVPGTWIFPNDPQVKLVAQRGLIVTQHHAIPLGVNVARWPADVPYNYTTHPEILESSLERCREFLRTPHQEILWSVGLRGLSDVSYASMDPSVQGNDKALGQLISAAIVDQMKIVRAVHPDAQFVTDFWQEGARLVQQGYLTIPPEVIPVWADTGYGLLQDKGRAPLGAGALRRGDAQRQSQSTFGDGARGSDLCGTGPLHQGRSDAISPAQYQRYSSGEHDGGNGDGCGLGRTSARGWERRILPGVGHGGIWSEIGWRRCLRVHHKDFSVRARPPIRAMITGISCITAKRGRCS